MRSFQRTAAPLTSWKILAKTKRLMGRDQERFRPGETGRSEVSERLLTVESLQNGTGLKL